MILGKDIELVVKERGITGLFLEKETMKMVMIKLKLKNFMKKSQMKYDSALLTNQRATGRKVPNNLVNPTYTPLLVLCLNSTKYQFRSGGLLRR